MEHRDVAAHSTQRVDNQTRDGQSRFGAAGSAKFDPFRLTRARRLRLGEFPGAVGRVDGLYDGGRGLTQLSKPCRTQ
jgi:hypothetical protein